MTGRNIKKPHLSRCTHSSTRWKCEGSAVTAYGDSKREAYKLWRLRLDDEGMHPIDKAHEAEMLAMRYFDQGFLDLSRFLVSLAKVIRYQHNLLTNHVI